MLDADWLSRKLIFIVGKGGVGKTTLAKDAAHNLAAKGKRTLLCHVLQVGDEEQKLEQVAPNLWSVTLRASDCFKEYIKLKLKLKPLYTALLSNKITQYLEKAAPGVREMVLLGKVWFERNNYDHVVVDMPSTGYALTMIHTPFNFAELFPGGPVYHDAKEMIATFTDPHLTAFVTVTIAEEMPIQESLELAANLRTLMPKNPTWLVLNRLVHVEARAKALYEQQWPSLREADRASPLWQGLVYLLGREATQKTLLHGLEKDWSYSRPWANVPERAQ